jgi:hypothetical protein
MGLFNEFLNPKPKFVKDIVTKIKAYFIDITPEVAIPLQEEAIFYAEKESNWPKIEKSFSEGKNIEFYSLFFIYVGTKDVLLNGHFHVYSGMVNPEGKIACGIACDCIDRLVQLNFVDKREGDEKKDYLRSLLTDIGIG